MVNLYLNKMKLILTIFTFLTLSVSFGAPWNQKAQFPKNGRHRAASFSIANKGYVGIGHMNGTGTNINFSDWWEYDPATNSWTQKADYPVANYAVSIFVANNIGYIGGGALLNGEFYGFNPLTNTWVQTANCPGFPQDETAFSINGKGYVTDNGNFYEYNPTTDQWTTKANCPVTDWSITSFVVDGKGYVKGNTTLYEYKPSVDQWTLRASFPGIATGGSAAFSVNQKGYIIGGFGGSLSNVTAELWEYNPANNSWTLKDDFPGTARRFCTAFSIGNKAYFTLGTNGTNMNDFWEYNPQLEGVGINENDLQTTVKTYPNPATTYIQFEFNTDIANQNKAITIYDLNGKIVCQESTTDQTLTINRNNLKSGHYYYTVFNATKLISKGKIIFN